MPGAAVAIVGVPFTEVPASAAASGEIRLEPGTRVVIDTPNLPTSDAGIDAQWYTTVTSRLSDAGVTTEIAELKCYIDLAGSVTAIASTTLADIIGVAATASSLGQVTAANSGTILGGTMKCLEVPAGGDLDIDLVSGTTAAEVENEGVTGVASLYARGASWAAGDFKAVAVPAVGTHLYLTVGAGGSAGTYSAGKFLLTFICQYAVPS